MELTKENLKEFKNDPLIKLFMSILGTTPEELLTENPEKKESCTEPAEDSCKKENISALKDIYGGRGEEDPVTPCEKEHVKKDLEGWKENIYRPSFSMSVEDLEEFIKAYQDADSTVRKIEHAYGIDLRTNEKSPYYKYIEIIWNLVDNIFGSDNRDDIADYIFGDSNFDTVKDLYEELL